LVKETKKIEIEKVKPAKISELVSQPASAKSKRPLDTQKIKQGSAVSTQMRDSMKNSEAEQTKANKIDEKSDYEQDYEGNDSEPEKEKPKSGLKNVKMLDEESENYSDDQGEMIDLNNYDAQADVDVDVEITEE
jgi:hypothetical protein